MIEDFETMSFRTSRRVHMLHAHSNNIGNNQEVYSNEQGGRFHQEIIDIKRLYQGQYTDNMVGKYISGLVRN